MTCVAEAFRRNPDGSWSCVAPIVLNHPTGRIEVTPGRTFARGERFMGIDLADWLDRSAAERGARKGG